MVDGGRDAFAGSLAVTRAGLWVVALSAFLGSALSVSPAQAQFSRPTECSDCIANWFYFDNGGNRDWNCSGSTYSGHRGSDFSLRGGNAAIDAGHAVVAIADGVVEQALDGNFDRCTACGGPGCGTSFGFGYGNYVTINHGDRKVTYAHMRNGSVRVAPGDTVRCGDEVGEIASSGCTTGAHLHLEVRPRGGSSATAYDPFEGSCSPIASTLWDEQGGHRGLPGATCGGVCPSGTFRIWTCSADRSERVRCIDGEVTRQACPGGCESRPTGMNDVCAEVPTCPDGIGANFTCQGNTRVRCVDGEVERRDCETGTTCMPMPGGNARCVDGVTDGDMDGHNSSVDCADDDATRYPGAREICGDGIDQDCNGSDLSCGTLPDSGADAAIDAGADAGGDSGGDAGGDTSGDAGGSDSGTRDGSSLDGGCAIGRSRAPLSPAVIAFAWLIGIRRRQR